MDTFLIMDTFMKKPAKPVLISDTLLTSFAPSVVEALIKLPYAKLLEMLRHPELFPEALTTAEMKVAVYAYIMQERKRRRIQSIKIKTHKKLWARLLAPLKRELANAEVGLLYPPRHPSPERTLAFGEYVQCLRDLLLALLKMQQRQGKEENPTTPSDLARDQGKPNNGTHWTDWVRRTERERIKQLFAQIPVVTKAKQKTPFQRLIAPSQHRIDKNRLQGQITRSRDIAYAKADMDTLADIAQAQAAVDAMKETDVVPPSWKMLINRSEA